MARRQRFSEFTVRRTTNRCSDGYQSAGAGARRQFWGLGRFVFDDGLCGEGGEEEGGSV